MNVHKICKCNVFINWEDAVFSPDFSNFITYFKASLSWKWKYDECKSYYLVAICYRLEKKYLCFRKLLPYNHTWENFKMCHTILLILSWNQLLVSLSLLIILFVFMLLFLALNLIIFWCQLLLRSLLPLVLEILSVL